MTPIAPFPICFWRPPPERRTAEAAVEMAESFNMLVLRTWGDELSVSAVQNVTEQFDHRAFDAVEVIESFLLEKEERNRFKVIPETLDAVDVILVEQLRNISVARAVNLSDQWTLTTEERDVLKTLSETLAAHQTPTLIETEDFRVTKVVTLADAWLLEAEWMQPTAPVLAVDVTGTTATLSWTASSGASEYRVYRDNVLVQTTTSLTWADSSLAADTAYTWYVVAANPGLTAQSNSVGKSTVPLQPIGVDAVAEGSTSQLRINWTNNSTQETGYRVFNKTTGQSVDVAANLTTYLWTGLSDNSTYVFTVAAFNAAGQSIESVSDSATTAQVIPSAPDMLYATPSSVCTGGQNNQRVTVGWANGTSSSGWVTDVQRGTAPAFNFQAWKTGLAIGVVEQTDTDQISGNPERKYRARHRHTGTGNVTGWSDEIAATPNQACSAPGSFTLSGSMTGTTANLSWTPSSSALTYLVYANGVLVGTTSATSFQHSGLTRDTPYSYQVVASNDGGTTPSSNTVDLITIPHVPDNVAATALSSSSIRVSWFNNSSTETAYRVRNITTGAQVDRPADTNFYDWGSLNASTTYSFTVEAINGAGGSGQSLSASDTTDDAAPAAPTGMAAEDWSYCLGGTPTYRSRVTWGNGTSDTAWSVEVWRKTGTDPFALATTLQVTGTSGEWFDDAPGPGSLPYGGEEVRYKLRHVRSGFPSSDFSSETPALVLADKCTLAPVLTGTSPNIGGYDSSTCDSGVWTKKKQLTWEVAASGWHFELQGEYQVVGWWASPDHTDPLIGTGCPSGPGGSLILPALDEDPPHNPIEGFETQRCISGTTGTYNTYRIRHRRANSRAPTGYDTSAWKVWQVVTGSNPCQAPDVSNLSVAYSPSESFCGGGGPVVAFDIAWSAPGATTATRIWRSYDNATWALVATTAEGATSYLYEDTSGNGADRTHYIRVAHVRSGTLGNYAYGQDIAFNPC